MGGIPVDPLAVLVTGASGFIAVHIVGLLLSKGFFVRGTIRSESKGKYLQNLFKQFGDKFEFVVVEDIEKEDAFDEAVKGMDAVEHTASPFHFNADDPKELIGPAVQGTVGVLKSIKKNAPTVKRVIVTSSVASIVEPREEAYTFTEKDWNQFSIDEVEKQGKDANPVHKYRASKSLAERAAWKFMEEEKPSFDLVTVCPPFVFGPILHEVSKPEALNTSVLMFWNIVSGASKDSLPNAGSDNSVDVRDVAKTHYLALVKEEAGGQRFISSTGPFSWQDHADALHAAYPNDETIKANVPVGNPGEGKRNPGNQIYSAAKAREVLGQKFIEQDQTVRDMFESLRKRGFV